MKQLKQVFLFAAVFICCALLHTGCRYDTFTSDSGTCGENVKWTLDYETGVMKISGDGPFKNSYDYDSPFFQWISNGLHRLQG